MSLLKTIGHPLHDAYARTCACNDQFFLRIRESGARNDIPPDHKGSKDKDEMARIAFH